MRAGKRFVLFGLSLVVAFATHVGTARAVATVSDRVVITDAAGSLILDLSVSEPAAGTEPSISFGATVDPFSPFNSITVLTEPLGAPPGENPIFLPGTNTIISDLFLSSPNQDGGLFLSDGDPLLAQVVASGVLSLPGINIKFLEETGDLQLVGTSPTTGFSIFVQSDVEVVPEPGTLLLFGTGLVGLAAGARRGRRLRA